MSDEVTRLIAAIDESPDPLHGDRTPAVDALVARGLDALPPLFGLLEEGPDLTRLRAQRVLEGVSRGWVSARLGGPPLAPAVDAAWDRLWRENGSYDWRAALGRRRDAVGRWRSWLAEQGPAPEGPAAP